MSYEEENLKFLVKLKELNENFLNILHKVHQVSPHCDFRFKFSDYMKSYEQIQKNFYPKKLPTSNTNDTSLRESNNPTKTNDNIGQEDNDTSLNFNSSILTEVKNELECLKIARDGDNKIGPRANHISWHEYFMSVAQLAAKRSKDPSTQVGACIVNKQNRIIATGYNGMPNGVHDDLVPWNKEGSYLLTKYAYVVHAELNAILNCVLTDQAGCRVYVSLFPCNECAKAIIQSGIRHVIFLSDKHKEKEATKAAKIMFQMAGVICEQYSSLLTDRC